MVPEEMFYLNIISATNKKYMDKYVSFRDSLRLYSKDRVTMIRGDLLKKVVIGLSSTVMIIVAACFFVPNMMMNSVKDRAIENNPDVENIVSINHISAWGEWFSQYVLIVEMDGQTFRIWSNDKGEIADKEVLE